MAKINFAVVGYGHIGKRHASMIEQNLNCKLIAIADIKPETELNITQHAVVFYDSLEKLLNANLAIDVVCIATPNGLHASQAIACLKHKKHVVIEKPMALSVFDGKQVLAEAKRVGKHVFPVMQNRYSPPAVWIKNILEQRKLGKIFAVQLNCYWNRDKRYYTTESWHGTKELDGGTLFTQFSHFIDMMYWLFGDITNIKSKFANFNHQNMIAFEDSGVVTFDFLNEGTGTILYSTSVWDKNFESSLTVIGEKGTVKIGGQYMNKVDYCHVEDYEMPILAEVSNENDYGTYKGSAANHHFVIENVVDVIASNKDKPHVTGLEAVAVIEIINRIYSN